MLLTISYSESVYPITPVEPLKAILYDYLEFLYILFTYIHINNNKFTYDKFKSAKFGFNIVDMLIKFY